MAIIVNTNMTALKTQKNLNSATNGMNQALNRMSTGYKINSAKDDAAGLYVATGLETQIRGSKVAQDNVATGYNVLQTLEGDLDNILSNLNRMRDLAVQASNSVYGKDAMAAMESEVKARMEEIERISHASNFNGLKLLEGAGTGTPNNRLANDGLRLQVGANTSYDANCITIENTFFADAVDCSYLGKCSNYSDATGSATTAGNFDGANKANWAGKSIAEAVKSAADGGLGAFETSSAAANFIAVVDAAINNISSRKSEIGAKMNRLESAEASLTTVIENNTAAKSTIMDADIAEESASYTKNQILQQTSAALLVQANALPQIAISLVQG